MSDLSIPLVSAIMPARGRSVMAAAAVESWKAQTWPNTELLILDDADLPAFPEMAARATLETPIPGATAGCSGLMASNWPNATGARDDAPNSWKIVYFCLPKRLTIGAKRNLACTLASGTFVAHADSDDYSAPDRLEDQVNRLLSSGKAVTGYHSMLFTTGSSWWRYEGQVFSGLPGKLPGVFGTSLMYRRDWWEKHHFVDGPKNFDNHEDKAFVMEAIQSGQLIGVPAGQRMFARVHSENTSPKGVGDPVRWKRVDAAALGSLACCGAIA